MSIKRPPGNRPAPPGSSNTYDINAYRRKKKLQKLRNRLLAVLSALTLLAAVIVGIYFYRNYDLNQLAQTAKNGGEDTVVTDHSFPVAMNGVNPVALSKVGSGVVLLTAEETIFFDGNGASRYSFNHQYTNPVIKSGGGRLLTYDRGGYGYRIDSEGGLHYNARMENTILTGAMGRKQSYALVTSESRYAASVTVYGKSNKEVLRWYSVSDQVLDVAFSYDGSTLAVAAVGFEDGDVAGRLYLLDLQDTGAEAEVWSFPGALPLAVDCKKNGSVHLLCDNLLYQLDGKGEITRVPLTSTLQNFCFTETDTVLITSDAAGLSFSLIRVSSTGEQKSVQVRGSGLDLASDGESIYVLEKSVVQRFDRALEPLEQLPISSDVFKLEASDGGVYLLSANQLDRWREDAGTSSASES
ncbi:MAG: DUF5711 family protein [Oscillospiraceae bacterium]|nr:DUF5711 family protein [Oscillospiraceae bacterium]